MSSIAVLLGGLCSASAVAQQADSAQRADSARRADSAAHANGGAAQERTHALPRVVVTGSRTTYVAPTTSVGTKTDVPVMETPLNVQTVTQQVLTDQQATTLATALQNVSGVSVTDETYAETGGVSNGILVRGFIEDTYYIDGFRIDASSVGSDEFSTRQLANVESVEVLKGPGAILYGLVEPGGIVNITTKQPLDAPQYAIEQQVGSLGDYRTTLNATGPLLHNGSLLYRVDMSYEDNDAPYGSKVDSVHSQNVFVAPVLRWNVDSSTWIKLHVEFDQSKSDYYLPFAATDNNRFLTVPRSVNYGEPGPWNQSTTPADLSGSHDFGGGWSIRGRLAFQKLTNDANFTTPYGLSDGPPVQVQDYSWLISPNQNTYSSELDATGHLSLLGTEHTILVGGDAYRLNNQSEGSIYGMSVVDYYNPAYTAAQNPCSFCGPFAWKNDQDTYGLYLQDQIKLPFDFRLLAGVRYQYIRQASLSGDSLSDLTPEGGTLYGHAFTPRAGLLWHPKKWLSLYTNYAEGFGANSGLVYPGRLAPPTSAQSWEAGGKLELFDGGLRISADYFNLIKTNIAAPDPNPLHNCGSGPGSCSILIGQARSNGPELDVEGEIVSGWSVAANYSHDPIHTTVTTPGTSPYPGVGQQFPNVPYDMANLWTTYEFQTGTLKGFKFGGGIHYVGATPIYDYSDPVGTFAPLPAYAIVDEMTGYQFSMLGRKATVQLNINNLLNKTYYVGASYDGSPIAKEVNILQWGFRSYGAPFSAIGSLRVEF